METHWSAAMGCNERNSIYFQNRSSGVRLIPFPCPVNSNWNWESNCHIQEYATRVVVPLTNMLLFDNVIEDQDLTGANVSTICFFKIRRNSAFGTLCKKNRVKGIWCAPQSKSKPSWLFKSRNVPWYEFWLVDKTIPMTQFILGVEVVSILPWCGLKRFANIRLESGEAIACSIVEQISSIVIPSIVSCESAVMKIGVDGAVRGERIQFEVSGERTQLNRIG